MGTTAALLWRERRRALSQHSMCRRRSRWLVGVHRYSGEGTALCGECYSPGKATPVFSLAGGQIVIIAANLSIAASMTAVSRRGLPSPEQGAGVDKVYDTAGTPYQGLLDSGVLSPAKQSELAVIYHGLNPVQLRSRLSGHPEKLWKLAERPASKAKVKRSILLTDTFEATSPLR